jgi:hypothetical protein
LDCSSVFLKLLTIFRVEESSFAIISLSFNNSMILDSNVFGYT